MSKVNNRSIQCDLNCTVKECIARNCLVPEKLTQREGCDKHNGQRNVTVTLPVSTWNQIQGCLISIKDHKGDLWEDEIEDILTKFREQLRPAMQVAYGDII